MKEQTFEELVKENEWFSRDDFSKREPLFDKVDVLKLLKQVREATIEEAKNAIRGKCKTYTPFESGYYQLPLGEQIYNLNNLPTDRIKIKQ